MSEPICVTPGEILGVCSQSNGGFGTYIRENTIRASLTGWKNVLPPANAIDEKPTIEVLRGKSPAPIPKPGVLVTARVTKVNLQMAVADILCVGSKAVAFKFTGIIRQQDVRSTEIDKVCIFDCFRPGDLVRAKILSLGDARAYFMSTAQNELGVVAAKSLAGHPMVPLNWQEMQCQVTGQKELRKVAKLK